MTDFVVVQHGAWPGWSGGVVVELESHTAAAVLTAARDFEEEEHVDLKGDLVALPAGGLRPAPWIADMQRAFDYGTHGRFANSATAAERAESNALYTKYNMDRASLARPATSSTHALGICADISDNRFLNWLIVNGSRYGLRRTLAGAPYHDDRHFQFFPREVTAALDVTSLNNNTQEEPPMNNDTRVLQEIDATGADVADWSRIGSDVLPVGTPGQPGYFPGGYEATTDIKVARIWITQYGLDAAGPIKRPRDAYVAQQQFGAKEYAAHQTALAKLIASNAASGSSQKIDYGALAKAVNDDAAARLAKL